MVPVSVSAVADLIEARRDDIIHRWTERVREHLGPEDKSQWELVDHIPDYLREVVVALRGHKHLDGLASTPGIRSTAREHGRQRYRIGFDVDALVREYGLLRGCILDLLEETGCPVTLAEVRVLTNFISIAIAEGVTEHGQQRTRAERERSETLLGEVRAREASLATTLTSIGDAVISTDASARITFLNPVAERLTGWSQGDVRGQPLSRVFRIINEHSRAPVASPVDRALAEGIVVGLANHTLLVRKDGTEVPIDDSAAPIRDERGAVTGVVLVFRDVTEKKRAEKQREELLREVEAARVRLFNLIENAPAFVCTLRGPQHVYEMVNPLYQRLVGAERQLKGLPVKQALPEVVEQGFITLLDRVYRTGEPFLGNGTSIQLDRGGDGHREEAFLNFVYQPRRDADGQVEGIDVFGFEVTEQVWARQRAEALAQRLRESEERLRRLVEASGAGFWELDAATGRIEADARVMTLLGLTPGAPLNLELALACVYAEDRPRLAQELAAALAGEMGEHFLVVFRIAGLGDKPLRWVENRGQRRLDAQGKPVALAGAVLDITARKEAEAVGESLLRALGESEERYRLATRATKDAIWDWNLVTSGVAWNEGLRELFHYPAPEVAPTGSWWLEHIHPEDRERISQSIHAVIDAPAGSHWYGEYRFRRHDGTWAFVEDRGWVTRDASGRALRMVGAMQDVSERKAAETIRARQLRHNTLTARVGLFLSRGVSMREMLQGCAEAIVTQLEAAFARIWLFNAKEEVLELQASAGLYTHLDGPHGRVPVGRYKIGLIAAEKQPHLTNSVGEDPRVGDPDWARREGMVAFAGYPLLVGDKLVGVVALFSREPLAQDTLDVLKQVADSIALGVERLRTEGELRTRVDFEQQLIGIVSHDLRNPLNAIQLGAALLAKREELDARAAKSVLRIQSSAERATRMVKDLLDFTQARLGGGIRIEPRPADLHAVTRGVLEEVEAAYPTRELEVRHEGDGQGTWDADRLAQVVQNLVTNALKYSPEDSLVRVDTRDEEGEVSLRVSNRGAPIPADKLASIFEPLQRATAEVDKTGRSVGLGLYIVKRIVDAHRGTVTVSSTEAEGTAFTVRLPRSSA